MCSFWEFQLSSAEVEANDSSRNLLLEMPNGYFFEGDTNTGKPLCAVVSSWIQKHAEFDICNPDPTKHIFFLFLQTLPPFTKLFTRKSSVTEL